MRQYEITYLLENEEVLKNDPVAEIITSLGGNIEQTKHWGQRNLAYPIKKLHTAHFSTAVFNIEPENLVKLNRQFNLSGKVMRFLIVKDVQITNENQQFEIKKQKSISKNIEQKPDITKPIASEKSEPSQPVKTIEKPKEVKKTPTPKIKAEKIIEKPKPAKNVKLTAKKTEKPSVTDDERLKQLEDKLEDLLKS